MAVELTTNRQRINYSEWNATGQGYWLYTLQYVYYEKLSHAVARVHVEQVVGSVSGRGWEGTNNHYRSRTGDWTMDSGYNSFGTIPANTEMTLWSGYYDISNSNVMTLVCYADTYGGQYNTQPQTDIYVPASAFPVAPETPSCFVEGVGDDYMIVTFGAREMGNPPYGTLTLYGDTSNPPTTIIESTPTSTDEQVVVTMTVSSLYPETTYYFKSVADNGVLSSSSAVVSATTSPGTKLYGSVNGETKQITNLYGSVNGETKRITKLYGSVNGETKRIL